MSLSPEVAKSPGCAVVLSPHLDDAVLSLGPLISAWRRAGGRVVVLTLFTGGPEGPLSLAAIEDRSRYNGEDPLPIRLAEDCEAARRLGFETRRAGIPELIFRRRPDGRPRCESLADIFGPLEVADADTIEVVAREVLSAIELIKPGKVFAPLGVGNHADHVITRQAIDSLGLGHVSYYQDMPYVIRGDAVVQPAGTAREPWMVDAGDIETWLHAVAAYESQLPILFADSDWRNEFTRWAKSKQAYVLSA